MKLTEIQFPSEEGKQPIYKFLNQILHNTTAAQQHSLCEEIAGKCETTEAFIDSYIADERTHGTQLYAELLKRERPDKLWYAIREMFGSRQFKTVSDAGGLLVGDENFNLIIPNGAGDGTTRVAVFDDPDDFNGDLMTFFTQITGEFGIYGYDCNRSCEPIKKITGRYSAYFYSGLIALVKK